MQVKEYKTHGILFRGKKKKEIKISPAVCEKSGT